jgi:hypothetical protein
MLKIGSILEEVIFWTRAEKLRLEVPMADTQHRGTYLDFTLELQPLEN